MFEGDIIEGNPLPGAPLFVVKFGLFIDDITNLGIEAAFYGERVDDKRLTTACVSWHSGRVIGNVHQHPALLAPAGAQAGGGRA